MIKNKEFSRSADGEKERRTFSMREVGAAKVNVASSVSVSLRSLPFGRPPGVPAHSPHPDWRSQCPYLCCCPWFPAVFLYNCNCHSVRFVPPQISKKSRFVKICRVKKRKRYSADILRRRSPVCHYRVYLLYFQPLPVRLDGCCIRCVGTDHHRTDPVSDASVS